MPELPENVTVPAEAVAGVEGPVDLVDLIDQPAWKTILIDLIKSEKMDPWAIDVSELAGKYLTKINQLEKVSLRIPANAILASAILLKMKARTLKLSALEEDLEAADYAREFHLMADDEIPNLNGLRQLREGRVSLDELVSTIENVLEKTKKAEFRKSVRELPKFTIPFSEENLNEKIEFVLSKITERSDSQGLVIFSRLLDNKDSSEIVNTFVPLLFLVNKGKVNAWQDEFWGEIFVQLIQEQLQNQTIQQQN